MSHRSICQPISFRIIGARTRTKTGWLNGEAYDYRYCNRNRLGRSDWLKQSISDDSWYAACRPCPTKSYCQAFLEGREAIRYKNTLSRSLVLCSLALPGWTIFHPYGRIVSPIKEYQIRWSSTLWNWLMAVVLINNLWWCLSWEQLLSLNSISIDSPDLAYTFCVINWSSL